MLFSLEMFNENEQNICIVVLWP